jgi:heat shock protein HtpX
MDNLFATHPAPENRIAALQELAQRMGAGFASRSAIESAAGARGPWGRTRGPWG